MLKIEAKEFWFVVGSQNLYGAEALKEVQAHSEEMVAGLNSSGILPYPLVFKALAVSSESIVKIMKEVNYNDKVAGVITWMHTFSPAKMWIQGTKLLQKPLLHFASQYIKTIPWEKVDMDFMNLHQSAHGDREYGFINKRLEKHNKIVVGHWQDPEAQKQIADWMNMAMAYEESLNIKVARFGDNMRNVAVTDGDKIEAQIQFGWTVDYYGIGDLVAKIDQVTPLEIETLYQEYQRNYDFEMDQNDPEFFEKQVKEQARIEIGLKKFLENGDYTAFSTNFEDLYGMKQLPGLAVQHLNAQGYGFAGEGDWKTAALDRFMKIIASNQLTGFMEDYTYDMVSGNEVIVGSHMLEVDPMLASSKPRVKVAPLGIGGKEDPARLVFDGVSGSGIVATLLDLGTHFRLVINEIEAVKAASDAPNMPIARVIWKTKPNFKEGIHQWIEAGGGHHTVLSLTVSLEQMIDWAKLVNLEYIVIK